MKAVLISLMTALTIASMPAAAGPDRRALLNSHEPVRAAHGHRDHGAAYRRHDREYRNYRDYSDYRTHRAGEYASRAIEQVQAARRLGFYPDHPRWSPSYERHYRWALRADPRQLQREQYRRAAKLRELRRYQYARDHGYSHGH